MVQDITEPLKAGESVNVWVQPREGIPAGVYKDTITYTTEEGAQASFEADFTVNEAAQVTDGNGEDTNAPQDQQKTDPAPSVTPDVAAGTALTFDPVTAGYTELPAGRTAIKSKLILYRVKQVCSVSICHKILLYFKHYCKIALTQRLQCLTQVHRQLLQQYFQQTP